MADSYGINQTQVTTPTGKVSTPKPKPQPEKKDTVPVGKRPKKKINQQGKGNQNAVYGDGNVHIGGNVGDVNGSIGGTHINVSLLPPIVSIDRGDENNIPDDNDRGNIPPKPEKPTIPRADQQAGKMLATRLHNETNSNWADNSQVATVFRSVNPNNAYSFFTEYIDLAKYDGTSSTTGAMHDSYDIMDRFNRIDIQDTSIAVNALLTQARNLPGVAASREFGELESLHNMARNKSGTLGLNADLSRSEANGMDNAIVALLQRMSQEYR